MKEEDEQLSSVIGDVMISVARLVRLSYFAIDLNIRLALLHLGERAMMSSLSSSSSFRFRPFEHFNCMIIANRSGVFFLINSHLIILLVLVGDGGGGKRTTTVVRLSLSD